MIGSLKEEALKAYFKDFPRDRQIAVIRDLMEIAELDSVIQNTRPVYVCGVEMNKPRDETSEQEKARKYRQAFDDWLYQFLPNYRIEVEKHYLNKCFELFQFIMTTAKGSAHLEVSDEENYMGIFYRDDLGVGGEHDREDMTKFLLTVNPIKDGVVYSIVGDDTPYLWTMTFDRLFILLDNRGQDHVNILLHIMGFFNDNSELYSKIFEQIKALLFHDLTDIDSHTAYYNLLHRAGLPHTGREDIRKRLFNLFPGLSVIEADDWR